MRGQATPIQSSRQRQPCGNQQQTNHRTSFPPTSIPSPISGRRGHQKDHKVWARTSQMIVRSSKNTWKLPDLSSLHNACRTRNQPQSIAKPFFLQKTYRRQTNHTPPNRGKAPRPVWDGPSRAQRRKAARQRQDKKMVELNGIEPLTPCLQSRCSPS
jgi:hypothetical protein